MYQTHLVQLFKRKTKQKKKKTIWEDKKDETLQQYEA